MSFSAIIKESIEIGGENFVFGNTYTGTARTSVQEDIDTGETVFEITVNIDVSEIKALFIVSTHTITVKTNSSGAPDDELALIAGEPLIWHTDSIHAEPLTVDVTSVFVANSSGETATLSIFAITDATPE